MSNQDRPQQPAPDVAPTAEPDLLPLRRLLGGLAALFAAMGLLLLLVWSYHRHVSDNLLQQRQYQRKIPELEEAKATDRALLTSYAAVDRRQGVFRIPIDQAIDLLLNNPALIEPVPLPGSAPADAGPALDADPASQPASSPTTTLLDAVDGGAAAGEAR